MNIKVNCEYSAITIRGLTIVELLVVIAIISIMASLMMPSLHKAIKSTYTVGCANNLRNIAVSFGEYAADNRDFVAPLWHDYNRNGITNASSEFSDWWPYGLYVQSGNNAGFDVGLVKTTSLGGCVYFCPEVKEVSHPYFTRITYGPMLLGIMNDPGLTQISGIHYQSGRFSRVRRPSRTMLISDVAQNPSIPSRGETCAHSMAVMGSSGFCERHMGGDNILYTDFHVGGTQQYGPATLLNVLCTVPTNQQQEPFYARSAYR